MFVLIQKANAIRETSKVLARNIYEQGIKDHMSKENILTIFNGVFSCSTGKTSQAIEAYRTKKCQHDTRSKQEETAEIADMTKSDMSANIANVTEQEQKQEDKIQ